MKKTLIPILKVHIQSEQDVVLARQRTRQIATMLHFESQDQNRLATAVSELSRNAFNYAAGGIAEFLFAESEFPQALYVKISDTGKGIKDFQSIMLGNYTSPTGMGVGLLGSKKLMDTFEVETSTKGTKILMGKKLRRQAKALSAKDIGDICSKLSQTKPQSPFEEIQQQNKELMSTLEQLTERQGELTQLNRELAETNSGVVALYAELDEKASSLLKANRVKTSFLSNMTHEFRTPLSSIVSMTGILLERLDGDLTEEQEKQTKFIRKSAEGLLELVNDLLDLAKVEAGKISINPGEFEIESLLGAQRGVFKPILANNADVELIIESDPIGTMITDENKVSQILRNLVSNAIKYTEKGHITLSAKALKEDVILFSVSDSGMGIAPENLEFIFEDFSQIESKQQKKTRGTGLGLPLSRKLARLLGGDLWATSAPGKGSTFYAKIPKVYQGEEEGQLVEDMSSLKEPAYVQ